MRHRARLRHRWRREHGRFQHDGRPGWTRPRELFPLRLPGISSTRQPGQRLQRSSAHRPDRAAAVTASATAPVVGGRPSALWRLPTGAGRLADGGRCAAAASGAGQPGRPAGARLRWSAQWHPEEGGPPACLRHGLRHGIRHRLRHRLRGASHHLWAPAYASAYARLRGRRPRPWSDAEGCAKGCATAAGAKCLLLF